MFKDYKGNTDWSSVISFSLICFAAGLMFWGIYAAHEMSQKHVDEKKAYKAKCIDAGGVPTAPFDYVKGHGEGYLCINPSAIIEVN